MKPTPPFIPYTELYTQESSVVSRMSFRVRLLRDKSGPTFAT